MTVRRFISELSIWWWHVRGVDCDLNDGIPIGSVIDETIQLNICQCKVGLVLLSSTFCESKYCVEESQLMFKRNLMDSRFRWIPILVQGNWYDGCCHQQLKDLRGLDMPYTGLSFRDFSVKILIPLLIEQTNSSFKYLEIMGYKFWDDFERRIKFKVFSPVNFSKKYIHGITIGNKSFVRRKEVERYFESVILSMKEKHNYRCKNVECIALVGEEGVGKSEFINEYVLMSDGVIEKYFSTVLWIDASSNCTIVDSFLAACSAWLLNDVSEDIDLLLSNLFDVLESHSGLCLIIFDNVQDLILCHWENRVEV